MERKESLLISMFAKHAFDFFSLFLAITLGFFVDNYRDDVQSRETADEMSVDLLSDLYLDTVSIDKMIHHATNRTLILNKLYALVDDQAQGGTDSLIYAYAAHINHRPWFNRHNSSYQLCLNTGYLQYFSKNVNSGLTEYNLECDKIIDLLIHEKQQLNTKIFPFLQKIFHTENFAALLQKQALLEPAELHYWDTDNKWLFHNYVFELIEINKEIHAEYLKLYTKSRTTLDIIEREYSKNKG